MGISLIMTPSELNIIKTKFCNIVKTKVTQINPVMNNPILPYKLRIFLKEEKDSRLMYKINKILVFPQPHKQNMKKKDLRFL